MAVPAAITPSCETPLRKTEYVPLDLSPQFQNPGFITTGLANPVVYRGVEFDRDGRLVVVTDRPVGVPDITAEDSFKRAGVVRAGDDYDPAIIPPASYFGSARDPATGYVYLVFLFDVSQ